MIQNEIDGLVEYVMNHRYKDILISKVPNSPPDVKFSYMDMEEKETITKSEKTKKLREINIDILNDDIDSINAKKKIDHIESFQELNDDIDPSNNFNGMSTNYQTRILSPNIKVKNIEKQLIEINLPYLKSLSDQSIDQLNSDIVGKIKSSIDQLILNLISKIKVIDINSKSDFLHAYHKHMNLLRGNYKLYGDSRSLEVTKIDTMFNLTFSDINIGYNKIFMCSKECPIVLTYSDSFSIQNPMTFNNNIIVPFYLDLIDDGKFGIVFNITDKFYNDI